MRAYKTVIFIFSVIAMLALLCAFFPREGVEIAGISLEFPSIEDLLMPEEAAADEETPEQLVAKRLKAIREAQKNDFLAYIATDTARIHFPADSIEYLDGFFEALDSARSEHMRILHYGDSQIEEDRISKVLRDSLQSRFGGGGPGLMPVRQKYYTLSCSEVSTREPRRYIVFGTGGMRSSNGRYGVMGQRGHIDSTITTTFYPVKSNNGPGKYFNRLTLLSSGGSIYVSCNGEKRRAEASDSVRFIRFELPDSTSRASLTVSGSHDIYGVMLDNDTGVSLDNMAMRGSTGAVFTSISREQLEGFIDKENVKLIILQYGGNVVPYTNTPKSISSYKQSIERQIRYLRELAPQAAILFIGPSDMSTNIQGKMQTYPHLPMIVDSLKDAALSSGAAFWDMYSSMGGQGSMHKWVTSQPALAGSDHVHFTPKGAEKMGGMLFEELMLYYDYYKLRKDE